MYDDKQVPAILVAGSSYTLFGAVVWNEVTRPSQGRFLASGTGGSFDLDQARRETADRVVVSKIRQTLEHLHLQPGGLGWQ